MTPRDHDNDRYGQTPRLLTRQIGDADTEDIFATTAADQGSQGGDEVVVIHPAYRHRFITGSTAHRNSDDGAAGADVDLQDAPVGGDRLLATTALMCAAVAMIVVPAAALSSRMGVTVITDPLVLIVATLSCLGVAVVLGAGAESGRKLRTAISACLVGLSLSGVALCAAGYLWAVI